MSLPPEKSDQLLNEYLDDALSASRLEMLESALAEDAALALRLQQLREERAERLAAFRDDPRFRDVRLSPDFTRRVVAAAAASTQPAATTTQPAATSSQPAATSTQPAAATGRMPRWVRPVVLVAGIAAAVLIAVSLFPAPDGLPGPGQEDIAQGSGITHDSRTPVAEPAIAAADSPSPLPADNTPAVASEDVRVAAMPRAAADPTVSEAVTPGDAAPERLVPDLSPSVIARAMEPDAKVGSPDNAADPDVVPDPAAAADPAAAMPLNMVMVYEVTRTARGKASDAVLEALRKAGIDVQARRAVGQEVVGYLQQAKLVADETTAQNADTPRASILYIEASGKALDRFMVSMFTDTDNIAQLRWNVATDPPLAAAVKQLQRGPVTAVRHSDDNSTAWRLVSGQGEQLDFAVNADARPLMPLQREGWNAMGSAAPSPGSQGPDIQSRLILLIR